MYPLETKGKFWKCLRFFCSRKLILFFSYKKGWVFFPFKIRVIGWLDFWKSIKPFKPTNFFFRSQQLKKKLLKIIRHHSVPTTSFYFERGPVGPTIPIRNTSSPPNKDNHNLGSYLFAFNVDSELITEPEQKHL